MTIMLLFYYYLCLMDDHIILGVLISNFIIFKKGLANPPNNFWITFTFFKKYYYFNIFYIMTILSLLWRLGHDKKKGVKAQCFSRNMTPIELDFFYHASLPLMLSIFNFKPRGLNDMEYPEPSSKLSLPHLSQSLHRPRHLQIQWMHFLRCFMRPHFSKTHSNITESNQLIIPFIF